MSLDGISVDDRFAVLAIDHRDSMRAVLAPDAPDSLSASAITEFKFDVVDNLAGDATGVMLDPEYSIPDLVDCLPSGVGFTAALEAQGYAANPETAITRVLDGWSAAQAAESGAAAAKLLVPYRPDLANASSQRQAAADILDECRDVGLPLVLEPLFYGLRDPSTRPRIVLDTVEHFAELEPDLLKLPFPVDVAHDTDRRRWAQACEEITARCGCGWTLLSGGGSYEAYRMQVAAAVDAGGSGFMVGRALWGPAVAAEPEDRVSVLREVVRPRLAELRNIVF